VARPSRRRELIDAAIAVIRRDGAQALTLDAVAAEAGVSKGGVLYHFGSKRALIDGLVSCWLEEFDERLRSEDLAAAYVRASDLSAAAPEHSASEFGMLAALVEDPEVLEVARERYAEWMDRMLGGALAREDAWLVRLAADGLWYSDLLGIAPPQGEDRRRVLARLLTLAQGPER
jgi:AcrR family transcriptional regulator